MSIFSRTGRTMNLTTTPSSLLTDPNYLKQSQANTQQANNTEEQTTSTKTAKNIDDEATQNKTGSDETAETAQQQMIKNIKDLQNKMQSLETDKSLSKTEQRTKLAELQQELDSELISIQISVKKNVSTLMGNLFSSAGNTSSGLLFNHRA